MSSASINHRLSAQLAVAGIGTGALAMTAGTALCAIAIIQGGLPGWSTAGGVLAQIVAIVPGALLIAVGLSLVMRGMHLRVTLDVLRAVGGLQQIEATAPPMPTHKPITRKRIDQSTILESPALVSQPEVRASRAAPIKGKPFEPHPIFMARPPR